MTLNKKLMYSVAIFSLLAGLSQGYGTPLTAYEQGLKPKLISRGLMINDDDLRVFSSMATHFVAPLLAKWQEAKAAGMSHADIRAIIGTNRNQAAIDALTKGIANLKNPGGGTSTNSNTGGGTSTNSNTGGGTSTNSNTGGGTSTNSNTGGGTSTNSNTGGGTSPWANNPMEEARQKKILETFIDKNMNNVVFKDRPKFMEYIMNNADYTAGVTKLIKEVHSFMLDGLEPEQYVMLKKENFPFEVVKKVAKLKPNYESLLKLHKEGKSNADLIAAAEAQNNNNKTEYTDAAFAKEIDLVIDKDKDGNKSDFFIKQPNYKNLRNALNDLDATGQAAYLAQMKADVAKFRDKGAKDFQICELMFEYGINVMALDTYVQNQGMKFVNFYEDATSNNYKARAKAVFGLPSTVDDGKVRRAYLTFIIKIAPDKWGNNIPLKSYYEVFSKAANDAYDKIK